MPRGVGYAAGSGLLRSAIDATSGVAARLGGATGLKSVYAGGAGAAARHGGGMTPALVPEAPTTMMGGDLIQEAVGGAGAMGAPRAAQVTGVRPGIEPGLRAPGATRTGMEHPHGLVPEGYRTPGATASRGAPAPPGGLNTMTPKLGAVPTTGASAARGMGTLMGVGVGAAAGATTSYMTGGNIMQGGLMGAAGGAVMGMGGIRMLAQGGRGVAWQAAKRGVGNGFTSKLTQLTYGMENPANRAYMFGAGGMLGGMMFGGNRSHKRGFNSKRGNSIGR